MNEIHQVVSMGLDTPHEKHARALTAARRLLEVAADDLGRAVASHHRGEAHVCAMDLREASKHAADALSVCHLLLESPRPAIAEA
jgi:hypothetical protein